MIGLVYDYPPKEQLTQLVEMYTTAHPIERRAIAKDERCEPLTAGEFQHLKEFNWRRKSLLLFQIAA